MEYSKEDLMEAKKQISASTTSRIFQTVDFGSRSVHLSRRTGLHLTIGFSFA